MSDLADVRRMLLRELEAVGREIALFPDDATVWQALPGVTNSAGTLALHLAGNLRHFVGGVLGGTGYVRDRDAEFARRGLTRAELAAELAAASTEVGDTLARLDPATLDRPYPAPPRGVAVSTRRFLIHLVAHTGFHLGQAGYLRRVLTGDGTTADAVAIPPLGEP